QLTSSWPHLSSRLKRSNSTLPKPELSKNPSTLFASQSSRYPRPHHSPTPPLRAGRGSGIGIRRSIEGIEWFGRCDFRASSGYGLGGRVPTRGLQKGGDPAAGSPTATLLRLRPSHRARLRPLPPQGLGDGLRARPAPMA